MSYLGKTYTLEKQEKFDQFLASLGVQKEQIDALTSEKSTHTLVKNGDIYTFTLSKKSVNFHSGVEFDDTVTGFGNKKCKVTFVVDGNTVTHTEKFENGITITYKKQYSDNKLVVEATNSVWDGVAYRYYSA